MFDISDYTLTRRKSSATSVVYSSQQCIDLLKINKANSEILFSLARSAGYIGAKLTPQVFARRHVLSIDSLDITFSYIYPDTDKIYFENYSSFEAGILIYAVASSIGRAPVDMECLSAAAATGLQLYEQLYEQEQNLELGSVKLHNEERGASEYIPCNVKCAILVCSDSIATEHRQNKSGFIIEQLLKENNVTVVDHVVSTCDIECIRLQVRNWVERDITFIFTCGGTGLGSQDIIIDAVSPLIDKKVDGVTQLMYAQGQLNSPKAMFSRTLAGTIGKSFIVTLPGSTQGVKQSLNAILPDLFYAQKMLLATNS